MYGGKTCENAYGTYNEKKHLEQQISKIHQKKKHNKASRQYKG